MSLLSRTLEPVDTAYAPRPRKIPMNRSVLKGGPRSGVPASCGDAVPVRGGFSALPASSAQHLTPLPLPRSTTPLRLRSKEATFGIYEQRTLLRGSGRPRIYAHPHAPQGDKVSKSIKTKIHVKKLIPHPKKLQKTKEYSAQTVTRARCISYGNERDRHD